MCLVIAWSGLR
jgi:hypothetical protein